MLKLIVIGIVIGLAASFLPGSGLLLDIIASTVGALLGPWLFDLLGIGGSSALWVIIEASAGSLILLLALYAVRRKSGAASMQHWKDADKEA